MGSDDSIIEGVKNTFNEAGLTVKQCHVRTGKSLISQYLSANHDTTAIVLSQYQGNIMYTPTEVDTISTMVPELKVILILDEKKGSTYLKELESYGIYTALFEDDANYQTIANLIINGRSKKEARKYYGVMGGSILPQQNTYNTSNAVTYLCAYDGSIEDITKRLAVLSEKLSTTTKMIEVLAALPKEVFDMVSRVEKYITICQLVKEQKSSSVDQVHDEGASFREKNMSKQKNKHLGDKDLTEIDRLSAVDVINIEGRRETLDVGFASTNIGVGCTTSAIMFAHSISKLKRDYKVAIVEFDNSDEHFENLCRVVTGQQNISGLTMFSVGEVDYYFNTSFSKFSSNFKPLYDVVIYDFGCCSDSIIENYFIRLYCKFVVASPKEWRYGELMDFLVTVSPKDINDSIVYLFPCVNDGQDMGIISEMMEDKANVVAIPYEANPYSPTKEVSKLFLKLFEGEVKKRKYRKNIIVEEKVKRRSFLSKCKVMQNMLVASVFLSISIIILLNAVHNSKTFKLQHQANEHIQSLQKNIDRITLENEKIGKDLADLDLEVSFLKEPISPGTVITEDMVDTEVIKTSLNKEFYLSKEKLGKVAACQSISAGDPLLSCMVADQVEIIENIPQELTIN
jgi:cell division protein FtsB